MKFNLLKSTIKKKSSKGYKKNTWNIRFTLVTIAFVVLGARLFFSLSHPSDARGSWWNDTYAHRQKIPLTNGSGTNQTDFQIELSLDTAALITAGKMQENCADMRFTNVSGEDLSYWLEPNTCNTTTTKVFVKVPEIPTSGADLYFYYDSPGAYSNSGTDNVFIKELEPAIANWPLDDSNANQSYARVINQGSSLGRDIVINGGFDDWTTDNPDLWDIYNATTETSGQQITESPTGSTRIEFDGTNDIRLRKLGLLTIGKTYEVTYTISAISGTLYIGDATNTTNFGSHNSIGTYTAQGTASNTNFDIRPASGAGSGYAVIDNVSIKQVDIPSSASIDSTAELLTDGDMETAGTGAWTSVNDAVLSKETTTPYAGSQVLRVTNSTNRTNVFGFQNILTLGSRYKITGYGRSNGDVPLEVGYNSIWWNGTTSTSWQSFDEVFLADRTNIGVGNDALSGTVYSEWDNLSVIEVSPLVGKNTNGVTIANTASGHLSKAYDFDGINDFVNIYSSDLNSIFDPDEGSAVVWAKVSDSGIWTDGQNRTLLSLQVDGSNSIRLYKTNANNTIGGLMYRNGNQSYFGSSGVTSTDWINLVLTWSKSSNEAKFYLNGSQVGATTTMPDSWIGNISSNVTSIGSLGLSSQYWKGQINDVRLYNRPLTVDEISGMYSASSDIQVYATDNYESKELIKKNNTDIVVGSLATVENAPGPLAYWSFNTLEGTTVKDQSENGLDGTINGATLTTDDHCITGKCLQFDGSNDFVSIGNESKLDLGTEDFTISGWINPISVTGNTGVINKGAYGSSGYVVWNSNGTLALYTHDDTSGANLQSTTAVLSTNNWQHFTFSIDRNGSTKLYINGLETAVTGSVKTGSLNSTTSDFTLGKNNNAINYFNGFLDEVKVYPYARTAAEVKQDYLSGAANAGSGAVLGTGDQSFLSEDLIGYWKMDETSWNGTAGEVKDASGNGSNGVAAGNSTTGAGKFGAGGVFDGVDDYVSITAINPGTENFTAAAWFNLDSSQASSNQIFPIFGNSQNTPFLGYLPNSKIFYNLRQDATQSQSLYWSTQPTNYADSSWHHVVLSVDQGEEVARLYIDGELVGPYNLTSGGYTHGNGAFVRIGKDYETTWDGLIDEVRFYQGKALSPSEVQALYNWSPGPVGYWKFDEGSGTTTLIDSSTNENTGSMTGFSESNWQSGRFGKALEFSRSTNTRIDLSTIFSDITTGFSGSVWIKSDNTTQYNNDPLGNKIYSGNNGGFRIYGNYSTYSFIGSTGTVSFGSIGTEWTHLGWSYNKDTGNLTTYVNGIPINTGAVTFLPTTNNLFIGMGYGSTSQNFVGLIDEVKLYNYTRTADQIREDMLGGHPVDSASVDTPKSANQPLDMATGNEKAYVIDGAGSDPVAYWKFDERTGATVADNSGNENTGTLTNEPEWISGKYGSGLSLNGVNNYVAVPSGTNITLGNDMTVSYWMKTNTSAQRPIISNRTAANGRYYIGVVSGKAFLYHDGGSPASFQSTARINDNTWHYVTFLKNSTTMQIYIDGKHDSSTTINTFTSAAHVLNIGYDLPNNEYFPGLIDEVKIFDYVLSPSQIAYEYNRGKPIGHWKMDECQGARIHDVSENENHGTLSVGATGTQTSIGTCDTSGSAWANGKAGRINGGMSFDGTDDLVTIADPVSGTLDFGTDQDFSLAFWLKTDNYSQNVWLVDKKNFMVINPTDAGYGVHFNGNSIIAHIGDGTAPGQYSSLSDLSNTDWQQYIVTFSRSGNTVTITSYLDGVRKVSQTRTFAGSGDVSNSRDLRIAGTTTSNTNFEGQIDDLQIFNYVLSDAQVKTLFNNGAVSFK